jgi:carbamoyl-phosphate synthase small subunit
MSRRDSNWRSQGGISEYLRDHEVVALADIDTRRLTRHLRDRGAMPVALGVGVGEAELAEMAASAPSMVGQDLATPVSTPHRYRLEARGPLKGKVVAIDLGMKRDILDNLTGRGFEVEVVPAGTSADEVLASRPDGVFVSNGPGDPEPLVIVTETLRGLLGRVPLFGICLGHQVLGLAVGASTFKLPFGHHGGNHPVRRLDDGRVEITAQNHGFAVDPDSLPATARVTHLNLYDGTVEGLSHVDKPIYSVQYHPEASPGPHDADYLFTQFIETMERR